MCFLNPSPTTEYGAPIGCMKLDCLMAGADLRSLLQVAQAIADLIWQHGAWSSAAVILHSCALQLPACKVQTPSQLEPSLAALETSVPLDLSQV